MLIGPKIEGTRGQLLLEDLPETLGAGLGAAFEEAFELNPTIGLGRIEGLSRERAIEDRPLPPGFDPEALRASDPNAIEPTTLSPLLAPEDANRRFAISDLKFDGPVRENVARMKNEFKRAEIRRRDILQRSPGGVIGTTVKFGAALAATAIDPLNIASAFIPVVGEARFAALTARIGLTGARLTRGAVEGAVGAAAVEPFVLAGARAIGADFDITDAMLDVAFGSVLGGGLHAIGGRVGDALGRLSPADRRALASAAVAQAAEGRTIDVAPVFGRVTIADEAAARESALAPARTIIEDDVAKFERGNTIRKKVSVANQTRTRQFRRAAFTEGVSGRAEGIFVGSDRRAYWADQNDVLSLIPDRDLEDVIATASRALDETRAAIQKNLRKFDKDAERLGQEAAALGFDSHIVKPADTTSRYVYVRGPNGEIKLRIADHPQPIEGGAVVGGFSEKLGRRFKAADFSIDPSTKANLEDAVEFLKEAVAARSSRSGVPKQSPRQERLTSSDRQDVTTEPDTGQVDEIARREALPDRESAVDFEAAAEADRVLADASDEISADTARAAADELAEELRSLPAESPIRGEVDRALSETDEIIQTAEAQGRAAKAAALCRARTA